MSVQNCGIRLHKSTIGDRRGTQVPPAVALSIFAGLAVLPSKAVHAVIVGRGAAVEQHLRRVVVWHGSGLVTYRHPSGQLATDLPGTGGSHLRTRATATGVTRRLASISVEGGPRQHRRAPEAIGMVNRHGDRRCLSGHGQTFGGKTGTVDQTAPARFICAGFFHANRRGGRFRLVGVPGA